METQTKGVWYVFRVPPQKELVAEDILRRLGFNALAPKETKFRRSRHKNRKRYAVEYPVLIGYVLVRFVGDVPWHQLFQLNIIKSVVGFDGAPLPASDEAVEQFSHYARRNIPHKKSANTRVSFAAGDTVQITAGAFEGHEVKVESIHGPQARILLDLLGSTRTVDVPIDQLEAA